IGRARSTWRITALRLQRIASRASSGTAGKAFRANIRNSTKCAATAAQALPRWVPEGTGFGFATDHRRILDARRNSRTLGKAAPKMVSSVRTLQTAAMRVDWALHSVIRGL